MMVGDGGNGMVGGNGSVCTGGELWEWWVMAGMAGSCGNGGNWVGVRCGLLTPPSTLNPRDPKGPVSSFRAETSWSRSCSVRACASAQHSTRRAILWSILRGAFRGLRVYEPESLEE